MNVKNNTYDKFFDQFNDPDKIKEEMNYNALTKAIISSLMNNDNPIHIIENLLNMYNNLSEKYEEIILNGNNPIQYIIENPSEELINQCRKKNDKK